MLLASASAVYAAPATSASAADALTLLSCAGSFVSLASMGVNMAILSLVLNAKQEILEARAREPPPTSSSVGAEDLSESDTEELPEAAAEAPEAPLLVAKEEEAEDDEDDDEDVEDEHDVEEVLDTDDESNLDESEDDKDDA